MFTQSDDNGLLRVHIVHVLMAVIILLFLLSCSSLPVFARTNRQAGSSAGFLDYCEESVRAPCLLPLQRGGFLLFQQPTLSLSQTWSGSVYQFSLAWQRHKPHVRTPTYPASLQYRPQSQASRYVVHVQVCTVQLAQHEVTKSELMCGDTKSCILWGNTLKEEVIDQLLTKLLSLLAAALWLNLDHTLIYPY